MTRNRKLAAINFGWVYRYTDPSSGFGSEKIALGKRNDLDMLTPTRVAQQFDRVGTRRCGASLSRSS